MRLPRGKSIIIYGYIIARKFAARLLVRRKENHDKGHIVYHPFAARLFVRRKILRLYLG